MGVGITWNDKNLDYEIETQRKRVSVGGYPFLETTRTSITRLKHEKSVGILASLLSHLKRQEPRLRDWNAFVSSDLYGVVPVAWNDKNLDYEIETGGSLVVKVKKVLPWNDKNLDYEIETR